MKYRNSIFWCLLLAATLLQGCANVKALPQASEAKPVTQTAKVNALLPAGVFNQLTSMQLPAQPNSINQSQLKSTQLMTQVVIYASPTTKALFTSLGVDAQTHTQVWERFLRKYKIPFKTITSVDSLEKSPPCALILPSLVALSEREKRAITSFRDRGGSVLATWLTGIRGESGEWQGFQFMETTLDTKVIGDTEKDENVNFLMPYGNTPVTHSLPAGQRIWLERVKDFYPLRLAGRQVAAQIMDWSRTSVLGKGGGVVTFDERPQASGTWSRSAVLGYSERLWMSADPKSMEAIAHNVLMWLLRQPHVYLSNWPFPHTHSLSVAIDAPDPVDDVDLQFASRVEKSGGRATYYVLSNNTAKSLGSLNKLKSNGHDVAYMGDTFEGFQGQTLTAQSKRLTVMQQEVKSTGFSMGNDIGFHAPMESQDKTTELLLNQYGFTHFISFMDSTDGRLPILRPRVTGGNNPAKSLVLLPRTLSGPEDLMAEGEPEDGLKQFLAEFEISRAMGGLSAVRFPNQTLLTEEQLTVIFEQLNAKDKTMWFTTNAKIASWWQDRNQISVELEALTGVLHLNVNIENGYSASHDAAIIINLPNIKDTIRLVPYGHEMKKLKSIQIDDWRILLSLANLPAGKYRWLLYLDHS
jgi:hypothetical protein